MSWTRALRTAIAFAVLVVLHYTVRPLLGWRAEVDFLVIASLLVAVRVRPGVAALVGCAVGLATDALTPSTFGAGALAMTTISFSASWLKAVFFADNLALNAFFFFVGKWVFDMVYLFTAHPVRGVELVKQLLIWSTLSATVTALGGIVLLLVFRSLLETPTA